MIYDLAILSIYGMYIAMGKHSHLDSIILDKYIPMEPMQSAVVNNTATFITASKYEFCK